jgi:hypothetical protein
VVEAGSAGLTPGIATTLSAKIPRKGDGGRFGRNVYVGVAHAAVSDGEFWMMSTPYGKRGYFYEEWECGGDRWKRVFVPATECPRIRNEFLEEQRSAITD